MSYQTVDVVQRFVQNRHEPDSLYALTNHTAFEKFPALKQVFLRVMSLFPVESCVLVVDGADRFL